MRTSTLALACLLTVAPAVSAGVLITTDGTVIETEGDWEQRGRMIVFTRPDGGLASIRVDDVDFDAIDRYLERASAPQAEAAAPAERPKARLVLTDGDVARVSPAVIEAELAAEEAAAEGGEEDDSAETSRSVRVLAWEDDDTPDGVGRRVFGTLRNDGNTYATGVTVDISIYDSTGALVARTEVEPLRGSLRPGESTTFSADFADVASVAAARLTVSSTDLDVGQATLSRTDDVLPDAETADDN